NWHQGSWFGGLARRSLPARPPQTPATTTHPARAGVRGEPRRPILPCRGVRYITPQILRAPGGGQHKPSDLTITGSPACRRQGSCIRASGPARSHSVVGAPLADARIAADRYVQRLLCARPLLRAEL